MAAEERRYGRGARTGLRVLTFWVLEAGRADGDVIAIEVGTGCTRRCVPRRTGETLDELEERANPRGSWRALPSPIFSTDDRVLSRAEWDAAAALQAELAELGYVSDEASR